MAAYYNELDPFAAQWLRNLIKAGHIAPGDVDERDIRDVRPSDVAGYSQCHFFAGIGIWSYALRLAKWADERPVWTGSCPCQPFSAAGRGLGVADERHLWPHWFHLINQRRPPVLFGEQVASKDGLVWLDLVHADLEGAGYAVGAIDCCAAGLGAPQIRQRLWIMAYDNLYRRLADPEQRRPASQCDAEPRGNACKLGHPNHQRQLPARLPTRTANASWSSEASLLDNPISNGWGQGRNGNHPWNDGKQPDANGGYDWPGPTNGFWRTADWLHCRDERWRAVEPGSFPLAHGVAGRMGRLRAYGNAITAPVATAFIEVAQECLP